MQLTREMLIRHPNRCTHNAVCIPVCPSGAIYAVYWKAGTVVEPRKAS